MGGLKGVRDLDVLVSSDVSCDDRGKCSATDADGRLLYADDNHLSVLGSQLQFRNLIEPYLLSEGAF